MEDHSATQSTSNYYKAKDYVRTSPLVDQDPKINFKVDVHTHILPSPDKLPDLKEKYGYGGFLSMEYHDHTKCKAKMLIDGKLMREVEHNCYSPEQRNNRMRQNKRFCSSTIYSPCDVLLLGKTGTLS